MRPIGLVVRVLAGVDILFTDQRDLTPERPFVPSTDSRDELARTASHHNSRRQKRGISEVED